MSKKNRQSFKPMTSETVDASLPSKDLPMADDVLPPSQSVVPEEATPAAEPEIAAAPAADTQAAEAEADTPVTPASEPAAPIRGYQANAIDAGLLMSFEHRFTEYCQLMGRARPVTAAKGSLYQLNLYRLFLDILRTEGSLFTKAWADLLDRVHDKEHDCFDVLYAQRFMNEIKALSKAELRVFMNLMHLVRTTADRKNRAQMLKTMDFTAVTANIPVPGAYERLHGFYFSA